MIKPREIQNVARRAGVRDQQIEKDYILSWILQGIAQHKKLSKALAFKGGTVLKKVYFEDYRFSEDLDFTLVNEAVDNDQILEWINQSFEYVREEANIPLEYAPDEKEILLSKNTSREELNQLGNEIINQWLELLNAVAILHSELHDIATEEEWPQVSKWLNKI